MIVIACNTPKLTMSTKHKTNTLETKYKAILEVEKGLKTKTQIAKDFNVPLITLSTWLPGTRSPQQPSRTVSTTVAEWPLPLQLPQKMMMILMMTSPLSR